ncbi:hypothetical protein D3C77_438390 [compost metagenome]
MKVFQSFLIFGLRSGKNHLPVSNDPMLQVIRKTESSEYTSNVHTPLHVHKAERDFIRLTVPVRILRFKGDQGFRIFI